MKKRTLFYGVICVVLLSLFMAACSPKQPTDTAGTKPQDTAATSAKSQESTTAGQEAAGEGDVWAEDGWPEHPLGLKVPDWEELPGLSDEYKFRQTDPSIEREMEGNMYKQGWPLVKETETLTVLARQAANIINIAEDHWLIGKLEERDNVKIEWELIPEAGWTEGRNLALQSGNLTDIIIGGGFSKSDQLIYGDQQGLFIDLLPYMTDEYTYYIPKCMDKRPDIFDYLTTPSGAIYSLPAVAQNFHVSMVGKMWVNTAWLENLGLERPTTTDEFADMLRDFKDGDPNQNGKADEMPLVASPTGWSTQIDHYLVNAFTLHPYNFNYFISENGKASMSILKDEYKEALRYINMLHSEGLVDRESFTRDGTSFAALGLAHEDYDIIGAFPGGYYGSAGYDIEHTTERSSVWEPLAPLKGPAGVQVVVQDPFGSLSEGNFVVTSACENPQLALRWIDYHFMPKSDVGPQDEFWRYTEEGEMNLWHDEPAYYTQLDAQFDGRGENIRVESTGFPYFNTSFETRAMNSAADKTGYDTLMYQWTRKYYEPYSHLHDNEYFPAQFFVDIDEADEYRESLNEIILYVREASTNFMIGDMDLDSEWDTYLTTINNLGLDFVLEHAQKGLDNYYGR